MTVKAQKGGKKRPNPHISNHTRLKNLNACFSLTSGKATVNTLLQGHPRAPKHLAAFFLPGEGQPSAGSCRVPTARVPPSPRGSRARARQRQGLAYGAGPARPGPTRRSSRPHRAPHRPKRPAPPPPAAVQDIPEHEASPARVADRDARGQREGLPAGPIRPWRLLHRLSVKEDEAAPLQVGGHVGDGPSPLASHVTGFPAPSGHEAEPAAVCRCGGAEGARGRAPPGRAGGENA